MKTDPFVHGQSKGTLEIPWKVPTESTHLAGIQGQDHQRYRSGGECIEWTHCRLEWCSCHCCPRFGWGYTGNCDNCWKFTRESKWLLHSWQQYENYNMFLNLAASDHRVWWVESKWCKNLDKSLGNLSWGHPKWWWFSTGISATIPLIQVQELIGIIYSDSPRRTSSQGLKLYQLFNLYMLHSTVCWCSTKTCTHTHTYTCTHT